MTTAGRPFNQHCHQPRHRRAALRGMTLIELAIALAVLAVLGAIALPSMGARLQHQRLLGAAKALAADVADARFEAAQRGSALQLQAHPGKTSTDWCWAVTTGAGCGCSATVTTRTACQLRNVPASEHAGIQLTEGRDVQVEATGGGSTAQQLATLESKKGEKLRVEISALGRPRVCSVVGTWPNITPC